jgi:hypothetical protein
MASYVALMQTKTALLGYQAKTISEMNTLSATLSNIAKNSYGIVYEDVDSTNTIGKVVVYDDKLEQNKTEIYIEKNDDSDISRVMIRRNGWPPFALHSSTLYITRFKVDTSQNPKSDTRALEDQPWISFSIEARRRSLLEKQTDDTFYTELEKTAMSLETKYVLRNYTPSSLKN